MNCAKCAVATILHIPTYPYINKQLLVLKCITTIFNLRPLKPKLNNVWDVDISFSYHNRLGDNTLVTNIILTQKLIVLLLLIGARRFNVICVFTVDNVTLNETLVNVLPKKVLKYYNKGRLLGKFEYGA